MSYIEKSRLKTNFGNAYDRGLLIWGEGPDEQLYEKCHTPVGIIKWIYQLSAGYLSFILYSHLKKKRYSTISRVILSASAYSGMLMVWYIFPLTKNYEELCSRLAYKYSALF